MNRRALLLLLLLLAGVAAVYQRLGGDGREDRPEILSEVTRVIDGDTFDLAEGSRIRLQGISAPERDEPGGSEATRAMKAHISGNLVRCEDSGGRSHGRVVARCFLGAEDIGGWLVSEGLARDCPRHSGGFYAAWETAESRTLPLPPYCEKH